MGIEHTATFAPMDKDPDDYRPSSSWALSVDPDGRSDLSVIRERIGVGDRIPRHWHDVDEVVLYTGGEASSTSRGPTSVSNLARPYSSRPVRSMGP